MVSLLLGGWPAECGWVRGNRLIADDGAVILTFSILLSVTMRHLPVRRNAPLDQILAPADEENAQRASPLSNPAKRTSQLSNRAKRTSHPGRKGLLITTLQTCKGLLMITTCNFAAYHAIIGGLEIFLNDLGGK